MSTTLVLFAVAAICGLVALVLHVMMIVHGFKTSAAWGLACLLVPLASVVFAFTKLAAKGKPVLAGLFAVSLLAAGIAGAVASHQTAKAAIAGAETAKAGLDEFEKATQALDGLEDLQLDDVAPRGAGKPLEVPEPRGDGEADEEE